MNLNLRLSASFLSKVIMVFVAFFLYSSSKAQVAGDYRSRASGNWSDFTTWQTFDGSVWQNAIAGQVPGGTSEATANNVYLEAGFTVTLTNDAACKDLHLNGAQDVIRINTLENALNIWGKMRSYTGTAPGVTDNGSTGSGVAGWINTGSNGRLRFKGTVDRTVFVVNELTANSRTAGWRLDFAFDSGVTGFCKNTIRCGHLEVTSGILDIRTIADGEAADYEIRIAGNDYTAQPGNGVSGGTCIVRSGATLKTFRLHKNTPTSAGNALASFILEPNAVLVAKSNQIPALVYDLKGEVRFIAGGQNFLGTGGKVDAVAAVDYTDVTLGGTGTKVLPNNITISGKLSMEGTATINPATFAIAYGANSTLIYKGSSAQTTTNAEFPSVNGPANLIINNSNGVKLHANRTIESTLTLTNGLFNLQNNNFTLGVNSPSIEGLPTVTNMIVTSGNGELRKIFNTSGYFFFPIGEITGTAEYSYARVDVNSADVLDGTTYVGVRVVDNDHPADNGVAVSNVSRYWRVSSNITNINYDATLQYLATDVNGTEADINCYNYSDETPLASGVPITRVNSSLHRIVVTGITSAGFITGANLCAISNNDIDYADDTELCGTSILSSDLVGAAAVVSSATPVYVWQQKVNSGSWTDLSPNGNGKDYTDLSSLSASNIYTYRRIVSDPITCLATDVNISNEIVFQIDEPITGNQIKETQIVSDGATPDAFTEDGVLEGGNDSYTYYWQTSVTAGGPYLDIVSANTSTYQAIAGEQGFYVRRVESGACSSISNEVNISIVTSNVSSDRAAGVNVYPNPTIEFVYLDLSNNPGYAKIVVMDNQGSKLNEQAFTSHQSVLDVDMSKYSSGLYYLQLFIDGNYTATYKVSKR